MVTLDDIRAAARRIEPVILHTPLIRYPQSAVERQLWFKPESLQPIGAFKLRGAYNFMIKGMACRTNIIINIFTADNRRCVCFVNFLHCIFKILT